MTKQAVEESEVRDRFALTRKQMLLDHAAISGKRRGAAAACAIRGASRQYLDILAMQATAGSMEWFELRGRFEQLVDGSSELDEWDLNVAAEIARVLLLHPVESSDPELALRILELSVKKMPRNGRSHRFRMLLVQESILAGRREDALQYLERWPDVRRAEHGYLLAEVDSPFRNPSDGNYLKWHEHFNATFKKHNLEGVDVDMSSSVGEPFDRILTTHHFQGSGLSPSGHQDPRPLVSVVITAFRPSGVELRTSVISLLNQTLQDLEVVVVDDASGDEFSHIFSEIEALDSRVKVLSLEKNSGTYVARNYGFGQCVGVYVTGQDDDDWSHPKRLETQVEFLRDNPEAAGCRVNAITCTPDLSRLRLGYKSINPNASSLMIRKEQFDESGGFVQMRKAADTEFAKRIELLANSSVVDLPQPLTLVRILADSLSRSEFKAGWSHPARRQIKSSYKHWHETARRSELILSSSKHPPIYVPRRFRVERDSGEQQDHYDVIIAGDWRQYGGPQKSMIEEIRALKKQGFRVAILHLEAPRFMSTVTKPMTPHIQELVNSGFVDEVLYDDPVKTSLLILRYPPILQFAPDEGSNIQADRMFIMANQAPSELDGRDIRYLVRDCHENAARIFTDNVTWVPQGPQVREAIAPYLQPSEIESFDLPGIVDPEDWETSVPRRPRGTVPVIGRHSRDNVMKWPEEPELLQRAYPTDGSVEVRVMGGTKTPQGVLDLASHPSSWICYGTDAMPVKKFLSSLDFFVFYQNSVAVEAFGRAILEAIAANLVVILPPHYQAVFGDCAVYAEPSEVMALIKLLHENRDEYQEQQERARDELFARFTHEAFASRVSDFLAGTSTTRMVQTV